MRLVKGLDISRREKNALTLAGIVSSNKQAAVTIDFSDQCSASIIFACATLGNFCGNPMTDEAWCMGVGGLNQHGVDSHQERASRVAGSSTWGTRASRDGGGEQQASPSHKGGWRRCSTSTSVALRLSPFQGFVAVLVVHFLTKTPCSSLYP